MRQRLGLAHALLGDPEVLILDEPANGLDPEGMRWMRRLLRDFADRGGTVLLSSHLLAEVEAVADRMIIIGRGEIQAQGTRAELLPQEERLSRPTTSTGSTLHFIEPAWQRTPPTESPVQAEPEDVARAAMAAGIALRRITPANEASLEQLFLELTAADPDLPELTGATT